MQPTPLRPYLALLRPLDPPARAPSAATTGRMLLVMLNLVMVLPFVVVALMVAPQPAIAWTFFVIWVVTWSWIASQYMIGRVQ